MVVYCIENLQFSWLKHEVTGLHLAKTTLFFSDYFIFVFPKIKNQDFLISENYKSQL